jgi:hypothetical protein
MRGLPIARRNDYLDITHSSRVDGGLAKQPAGISTHHKMHHLYSKHLDC